MGQKRRLFLNIISACANQIVAVICAFILPRFFIATYGSETNGLISSISQFLSFVSLLDMGVSTVVRSALYKPIAENDTIQRNRILSASQKFFGRISIFLISYTALLMIIYPSVVKSSMDSFSTALLIFAISFSNIGEYLFGITNEALLVADQKAFINFGLRIVTTILNTIICIVIMKLGSGVVTVKLVSSLVFLIRPLGMVLYIRKKYSVNYKEHYDKDPIEQKWNGLAHHLASFVFGNTDIVILTLFSSLQNVSVYSVYLLVVSGLNRLYAICLTGVGSLFGDLYARNDFVRLRKRFYMAEWASHNIAILMFASTGVVILNFVSIYTKNINDTNYIRPVFAVVLTLAYGLCCIRNIYNILIVSAGHFKQTQMSSIFEALINIITSIILVHKYGLVGVAIGTLVAIMYQQIYYYYYLHNNIVKIPYIRIMKQILVDFIIVFTNIIVGKSIFIPRTDLIMIVIELGKILILNAVIVLIINMVFYKQEVVTVIKYLGRRNDNE